MAPKSATVEAPTPMEMMAKERSHQPFDLRRLTYALHGGERNTLLKEKFMKELERNPAFRLDDIHDLSKDEVRERTMAKFSQMVHYVQNEPLDVFTKRIELVGLADPAFWTRFGVHYGLFLGAIRSNATPNQFAYWLEAGVVGLNGIIGCFGMTELAHGSNVAGLETEARFDEKSDEFVIHTPSVSATKWWIGGAAATATHCAVFARLIIQNKDYGVKTFIVPLRNPKTFALLPGINIGDIGKKMGRDGIDNGYIQFTYVRIPRSYMLMKYTQVTRQGVVHQPPLQQLTYGALLQGRTAMVADAANVSQKALTIACRYGVIRRQFKTGDNPIETQILDYPIHQRRLMPLVAQSIAMSFTAIRLTTLFTKLSEELETFDASADEAKTQEVMEKLKETHATSAGLKAFGTWASLKTIEEARQACGGHGYSAYVGLANMYADQAVAITWEGDGMILALQSGRSLISSYGDASQGKKVAAGVAYLMDKNVTKSRAPSEKSFSLETIDRGFQCVAANVVRKASDAFAGFSKSGLGKDQAFERCSQERFVASRIHTEGYIFRMFREAIEELRKNGIDDKNGVVDTLEKICLLYGLWQVENEAVYFLRYGFFLPEQIDQVNLAVDELCADLRKSAIALTDAFNFSDHIINSPLGRYDGDVYVAYFNQVRAANPLPKVHPYFDRIIKPLLERPPLEFEDGSEIGIDEEIEELLQGNGEEEQAAPNIDPSE